MLLVTSLEALIVPRPDWRKEKATKRFIEAIRKLCPDMVDAVVSHGNVEQAFDYNGEVAQKPGGGNFLIESMSFGQTRLIRESACQAWAWCP